MKLPRGMSPKKHLSLRLPTNLFAAIEAEEERTGETRNQIIERLLTKGLEMTNTKDLKLKHETHFSRLSLAERRDIRGSLISWLRQDAQFCAYSFGDKRDRIRYLLDDCYLFSARIKGPQLEEGEAWTQRLEQEPYGIHPDVSTLLIIEDNGQSTWGHVFNY